MSLESRVTNQAVAFQENEASANLSRVSCLIAQYSPDLKGAK